MSKRILVAICYDGARAEQIAAGVSDFIEHSFPDDRCDAYFYGNIDTSEDFHPYFPCEKKYIRAYKVPYAEGIAQDIFALFDMGNYSAVVFAGNSLSRDAAVLSAQIIGCPVLTGVHSVKQQEDKMRCIRRTQGNIVDVQYDLTFPAVLHLVAAPGKARRGGKSQTIERLPAAALPPFIAESKLVAGPERCEESSVAVVAGMGVRSRQDVEIIRDFAQTNHFLFGVTRPVAMHGWADVSRIVGVSGMILSPQITITIGVSGAAAFYAGIENSRYILSVNNNEVANIVKLSDAVIIDDYINVLPTLFEELSKKASRILIGTLKN